MNVDPAEDRHLEYIYIFVLFQNGVNTNDREGVEGGDPVKTDCVEESQEFICVRKTVLRDKDKPVFSWDNNDIV